MDGWDLAIIVGRVLLAFLLALGVTVLLVWAERKIVADMQNRIGPSRAGPWGILQTIADGLKLFFKESITPQRVDRLVYSLAPALAVIPAFLLFLAVPVARPFQLELGGQVRTIEMAGVDLNIGLLYILGLSSVGVYAVVLAGWSSGSKYPLVGGVRATAQAISYEAAMGLAMVAVVMFAATAGEGGTLSLPELVQRQQGTWVGAVPAADAILRWIPRWNILPQFLAGAVFLVAIVAETNRAPFDLVEAEQEIVGGFHTEYSGMRFAMFFLAEYVSMFTMSAIAVSLFFGGWGGPVFGFTGLAASAVSFVWFMVKVAILLFGFVWARASFPRFRYDQLMTLGWKRLIPLSLVWLILSTVVISVRQFGVPWA